MIFFSDIYHLLIQHAIIPERVTRIQIALNFKTLKHKYCKTWCISQKSPCSLCYVSCTTKIIQFIYESWFYLL